MLQKMRMAVGERLCALPLGGHAGPPLQWAIKIFSVRTYVLDLKGKEFKPLVENETLECNWVDL